MIAQSVSPCVCLCILQKNAVIDSLQEQVNNAKGKLLRLMSSSQPPEDPDMDSSVTNLNSCSTQTTELQSDEPSSSSLHRKDSLSQLLPCHRIASEVAPSSEYPTAPLDDIYSGGNQQSVYITKCIDKDKAAPRPEEDVKQPASLPITGSLRTAEETVNFVTSLQHHKGLNPLKVETFGRHTPLTSQLRANSRLTGFVSSEQLQEILRELSVDAVLETTLRSPGLTAKTPPQVKITETSTFSPASLRTPRSYISAVPYPSISPYAMRKRRPPFHSSRRGLIPPCFYTGCEKKRENCEQKNPFKDADGVTADGTLLQDPSSDLDQEENKGEAEGHRVVKKCQRCVSGSHRCPGFLDAEQNRTNPANSEASGDNKQHRRHIRDSCGYWDSDSSSSTDYCYYHRPYCDSCLQRGSLLSSDSSSDSSDSEFEGYNSLYRSTHPVVFKEDLKPTFV